ncbi:MAG TPA: hypothetical protein VK163_08300 [Opitutaceae bacterium]|nr:hypothetical protein [Opitutaceae bacterium]
MKVALLSESPADEAALRLIAEGVLGEPVELIQPPLRARGWPSVAQVLPVVLRHLHFRTDADGIVVTVDADDTVVHTVEHERPGYFHPGCRLCELRAIVRQTLKHLPPAQGRARLHSAVGLAVPAVEAWYLSGRDDSVGEEAWLRGQARGEPPYTRRELKRRVYGTERPSLPQEIACAEAEVRRHGGDFRRLEFDFPGGFGALAADLRRWRPAPTA